MAIARRALAELCGEGVSESTTQHFALQKVDAEGLAFWWVEALHWPPRWKKRRRRHGTSRDGRRVSRRRRGRHISYERSRPVRFTGKALASRSSSAFASSWTPRWRWNQRRVSAAPCSSFFQGAIRMPNDCPGSSSTHLLVRARDSASSRSRATWSTGLVKWVSNPASSERRRSSCWPQPVRATSKRSLPGRSLRIRRAAS
jgi:hypothetical protein